MSTAEPCCPVFKQQLQEEMAVASSSQKSGFQEKWLSGKVKVRERNAWGLAPKLPRMRDSTR